MDLIIACTIIYFEIVVVLGTCQFLRFCIQVGIITCLEFVIFRRASPSFGSRCSFSICSIKIFKGCKWNGIIHHSINITFFINVVLSIIVIGFHQRALIVCWQSKVRALAGQSQQLMIRLIYQVVSIGGGLLQSEFQHITAMSISAASCVVVIYLDGIFARTTNIIIGSRGIRSCSSSHHNLIHTGIGACFGYKALSIVSYYSKTESPCIFYCCHIYPSTFLPFRVGFYSVVIIHIGIFRLTCNFFSHRRKNLSCPHIVDKHRIRVTVSQFPEEVFILQF